MSAMEELQIEMTSLLLTDNQYFLYILTQTKPSQDFVRW